MHNVYNAAYCDRRSCSVVCCVSVSLSVCHSAALCKTAKLIEVLYGMEALADPGHTVLDGVPTPTNGEKSGEKLCPS